MLTLCLFTPQGFPAGIPEYFIRMLTDKDDLVVDPFAGSCVTGEVAEALGRRWVCCELSEEYLKGARARFVGLKPRLRSQENQAYQIYPPCSMNGKTDTSPLSVDGGFKRPLTTVHQKTPQQDVGIDS